VSVAVPRTTRSLLHTLRRTYRGKAENRSKGSTAPGRGDTLPSTLRDLARVALRRPVAAIDVATYVSFAIGQDGVINGIDNSGAATQIGQVGLATFPNPEGLQKVGHNDYIRSASSGVANIGVPQSGGRGELSSGYLEGSNVDLAKELTNLIVAERGFQANSKSITTSDEVLQTLVNLKQ